MSNQQSVTDPRTWRCPECEAPLEVARSQAETVETLKEEYREKAAGLGLVMYSSAPASMTKTIVVARHHTWTCTNGHETYFTT